MANDLLENFQAKKNYVFNTSIAAAIFRKLDKKRQVVFFYLSKYEITRSLVHWKGTQFTSYLVVGRQRIKANFLNTISLLI